MQHYVYKTEHVSGMNYFGKRTTKRPPFLDTAYWGSGKQLKVMMKRFPSGWSKTVLAIFDTPEEAQAAEGELLRAIKDLQNLNVQRKVTGVTRHSEATKKRFSELRKGKMHSPEHQAAITASLKGKTAHSAIWQHTVNSLLKFNASSAETV